MKKKLLSIVAAVALLSLSHAAAQEKEKSILPRHYVQFSIGDPLFNQLFASDACWIDTHRDDWFAPDVYGAAYALLPTFSFTYYYSVLTWLQVGGEVQYYGEYSVVRDRLTHDRLGVSGYSALNIMPSVRFQYLNKRYVGLYSGVSLGLFLGFTSGSKLYDPTNSNECGVLPAFQVTALGVRVGNKVFGTAEIGVGNKGFATIGIGARF